MKEGDIAITVLPQADGISKRRPVLILRVMPSPYNDYLVCGISTRLNLYIDNFDELVSPADNDFESSGIIKESVIRLSFLTVIPSKLIAGSIGHISSKRHKKLLKRLSDYLINAS